MCSPIRRGSILPIRRRPIQVQHARLQHLHAAERQQLARQRHGAVGGFANLLGAALQGIVGFRAIQKQIAVAANDGQQIIEIVRDAAGQAADGFHLVRLAQAFLELLRDRPALSASRRACG